MTISAKQVMDLRAATGMPMMQCKRALEGEDGDYDKAVERLRKEGMKAAEKRADKEAREGLVRVRVAPDGDFATLLAVACETEPVARTDLFLGFVEGLAEQISTAAPDDIPALLEQPWAAHENETVGDVLTGLIGQIREKIEVAAVARLQREGKGLVGGYQHHDQKQGAIVWLESDHPADELDAFAKQLCMHIVFAKPTALTRDEIPAEVVAKEQRFLQEQLAEDPKMASKPAQVIEKILEGKLSAFYKQSVLGEQEWALPDSDKSVGELLKQHGATIKAFRFAQVG